MRKGGKGLWYRGIKANAEFSGFVVAGGNNGGGSDPNNSDARNQRG